MEILTIEGWVGQIREAGKTIIVEGKKDKRALENLGITDIVVLSKKPLFAVIEEVASRAEKVIILTDFDSTGKALYGKLSSGLQHQGVEIDNRFREFLYRQRISHIEGLDTYFEKFISEKGIRHG
jgi:5S rRNA maturation endonuclease (ribonuclease M5)